MTALATADDARALLPFEIRYDDEALYVESPDVPVSIVIHGDDEADARSIAERIAAMMNAAPATPAPAAVTRWAVKCGKCAVEQHANGRCPDACPICGAVHPAWPKPTTPAPAAGARLEGGARHDAQIGTEPMPPGAVTVGTFRHEGATPGERVSAHPFVRCPRCGQCDTGQTGEYPCPDCGLPTVWDDVADASDCSDAFEVAVAEYGMAAYHAKGQGFNDPAVSAAAARVFMSYRAAVAEAEAVAARLYATAAPLPAPSASAGVGAETLAEWRETADLLRGIAPVAGYADAAVMRLAAAALTAACDALSTASAPQTPPLSAEDAREAALAYHDFIGLGCGWRGYRNPCPCCDAFMAGWSGRDMPNTIGLADNYGFAYAAGRAFRSLAKEAANAAR